MATLTLGYVGNFFGGPIGGFIGAALGAYIDQAFLMPALFPQSPIEGPRIDDRRIQLASEGSDMVFAIGPRVPVTGTVIYLSDLEEVPVEQEVGKGGGGTAVTNYTYFVDIAIHICDTKHLPGNKINRVVRVMADSKLLWDGQEPARFDSIKFYDGSQTTVDPTLAAAGGLDATPTYINSAYCVIKRLALADFGNRPPSFRFHIEQDADLTLAEGIKILMNRWGFEDNEISTARVTKCLRGFQISGPQAGTSILQPLLLGYGVDMQENDSIISFFDRGRETVVTIDEGDLAAAELGTELDDPLEITERNDVTVPEEVEVTFTSTANNLQQGSERHRRTSWNIGRNIKVVDFPVTMHPDEANAVAKRMLFAAELERRKFTFRLPPSMQHLQEGDVAQVTSNGETHLVFVQEITMGANFMLEVSGVMHDSNVFSQTGISDEYTEPPINSSAMPQTEFFVFDAPALASGLHEKIGLYFAICNRNSSEAWRGGVLYTSTSQSGTYTRCEAAPAESTLGRVTEPLGESAPWQWDNGSRLTVELKNGSLSSCSEQECVGGTNRAAVQHPSGEWEIIGFAEVVDNGGGSYTLTKLLRGLRGTEHLIPGHIPDAPFVKLSTATIGFWERGSSGLGTNDWYKAPAIGGILDRYDPKQARCRGVTMRPFSVTHLELVKQPRNIDKWVVDDQSQFTFSSSTSKMSHPTAGFFSRFRAGDVVTISGSVSNDQSVMVLAVTNSGRDLLLDTILIDESSGGSTPLNVVEGDPGDLVIKWRRRSKQNFSPFSGSGPLSADETPLKIIVKIRNGGIATTPLREFETSANAVVYTKEDQVADGMGSGNRLLVTVEQVSSSVGSSVLSIAEIVL